MNPLHLLLSEDPVEEPNLAPLSDFFFVVLMVVLLKASFFLVRVDSTLAKAQAAAEASEHQAIPVQVLAPDSWRIGSNSFTEHEARHAIESARQEAGGDAIIALSFSKGLSAEASWRIRAELQHEWRIPFVETQPLDLGAED